MTRLKGFLKELRRRSVLKVAVAYVATGIVALEAVSHLFHNFEAPHWVLKVFTTLLILGLPVACLMSWGFEFTSRGVRSIPRTPADRPALLPGAAASLVPSIAVLPFADMSAGHDQQYLGDGIAEELLNALASIGGLNVAARTSSFSFTGQNVNVEEIGRLLHVRHVLEGSVRRAGTKLRVTAQLIDVNTGFHLYTQSYDRELQDIFAIQNAIARDIVRALLPKLGLHEDATLVRHGTSNLEAYSLWLEGHQWLTTPMPATAAAAIGKLRQAVALDPAYADAWGALSYVSAYAGLWATDPAPFLVDGADAGAVARTLAPDSLLALTCQAYLSMLVHRDPAAAAAHYERARSIGADESVWAYNKAYLLDGPMGWYEQAIDALREAESRDPLAPNLKWALMEMYLGCGRLEEAVAIAESQRESRVPDMMVLAGLVYLRAGQVSKARECLSGVQAVSGDYYAEGMLLHFAIADATGNRDEARRLLDVALLRAAQHRDVSPYVIGEGYKASGDYDKAIEVWTHAAELRAPWTLSTMPVRNRSHPRIGNDPRFLSLLDRMGLAGARRPA